jgi:hypothetical protein
MIEGIRQEGTVGRAGLQAGYGPATLIQEFFQRQQLVPDGLE